MIVIPAVDAWPSARTAPTPDTRARDGADPVRMARDFARYGFPRLHLTLRGDASPSYLGDGAIREILFDQSVEVQLHGALTDTERIRDALSLGARFAVVSGRALEDPDWLREVSDLFEGDVILAVEVRRQRALVGRWPGAATADLFDLLDEIDASALAGIVVSDDERRRRSLGPDLAFVEDLAEACPCPVFVAGGIDSLAQLRSIDDRGAAGAIVGRAFATGQLNPFAVAEEFAS